ncbi:tetratricopeptide repeat protein [Streptomyces sp. A3M-1-3]|uniref:BTAD domain-containing putative transcriptional regulator n=1 Tax=Streptomyces sp. A3M-1-3 TaxID=2962044 RepID=UPI0020B7585B|nr:BTAD domain-containing putative transcriptional regulator [Streptomyces sp. A3M-1-3]MCP3822804.1 tetratricopeptide repeat protein [Streptomyces sp. A3M-1-3]
MRFGVLGPLAAWTTDGQPVRVPEAKVRALLAALLLANGRAVSTDTLVDALWGDDPPGNPANTLQGRVSQLRRALEQAEPGARNLLVHQSAGYLLRVDSCAVDTGRFTELITRSRETDDLRTKARLLSDAMVLWRGPALADFADDEFARPAITRLEEQRLVALEEQAEVRLALGEHRLLVGELGDLVDTQPFRERLRAAHMLALYRSGRQSEALASYGDLAARLADELGLDPAPELVALHQAILRQDPELDAAQAPAARVRTNLPSPLTGLVGREGAVSEVCRMLAAGRLVTLTGSGGVGKTRLAIETATRLAATYPDGAWLVELAALRRNAAASPAEAIMAVLGIREDGLPVGEPAGPADRLHEALRDKQLLLVLDNCEHVIEQIAELVGPLLLAAPAVRVLATSQEPLGMAGELLLDVPSLELPDPAAEPSAMLDSSAVQLFVARAAAVAPGFALSDGNAGAVAELCRRLDGIPLALELAATRVRVLGVHELVARLDDRFGLLASGQRGVPARQRTLRAVIDWSWELLTESECIVLRRLAVQAEGCTLQAAEQVCAGDSLKDVHVLDLLARLVDRSLVAVTDSADGPRYRLLESVAVYCIERLRDAGEFGAVTQRHASYYADLAERAEPHLRGQDQRRWLERLDVETANLRSALDSAVLGSDQRLALRLVNAMAWYLYLRGRLREARRSLEAVLAMEGGAPDAARAAAVAWRAGIVILQGVGADPAAESRAALKLYDTIDDRQGLAKAQWFHGFALFFAGDLAAGEDLVNRAIPEFRGFEDHWGVAAALSIRAHQALTRGDLDALKREGEQSAARFRELGDRWGQVQTIFPLASLAEINGDYEQAGRLYRDGLRMAEDLGLWPEVAYKLCGLGRLALLAHDYTQAREFHNRALLLATEQSFRPAEIFAEIGLGLGARRMGRLDAAEKHLRTVLEFYGRVDVEPGNTLILAELGFIAEQRGDAETALALHLEGFSTARDVGDPRAMALALEGLAGARSLAGHPDQAALLLGTAAAARHAAGAPLPAAERGDVDRISATALQALGSEAFAAEFERGGALEPDRALLALDGLGCRMKSTRTRAVASPTSTVR